MPAWFVTLCLEGHDRTWYIEKHLHFCWINYFYIHSYSEFIYNKLSPVTYLYVYILNNLFTIDLQISYCPEISFDCKSDTYLVQNRKSFFSPRLTACNYLISFWSLRLKVLQPCLIFPSSVYSMQFANIQVVSSLWKFSLICLLSTLPPCTNPINSLAVSILLQRDESFGYFKSCVFFSSGHSICLCKAFCVFILPVYSSQWFLNLWLNIFYQFSKNLSSFSLSSRTRITNMLDLVALLHIS